MSLTTRRHSIDAYLTMLHSGRVVRVRGEVCVWLHAHGPASRNQIDSALGGGRPNPPHSRRLSELRELGVIHVVGERDGSDLWDVTEEVPPHRPRPKNTRRQELGEALRALAKLLRDPRAKVFPDSTIEAALSIIERVEGPTASVATP